MLETILYYVLIWFNTGVAAQILMCIFDAFVNHRWPFHWKDAKHFVLAGVFGFLSAFNAIFFILRFLANPDDFITDEDEEDSTPSNRVQEYNDGDPDDNVLYLDGLNEEEMAKVIAFVEELQALREKKEKEKQNVE